MESANVALRRELDLFANVRPVRVPDKGIDWTFFRENTEGAYAVGSKGVKVTEDLFIDFTVATKQGSERIIRSAFEFAAKNGKTLVSVVTKANVIKKTDGLFVETARKIALEYPGIDMDEWYADIFAAKILDEKRRSRFQVIVCPNLYGDILSDEAAELMGGVGSAGGANIGNRYAMFEAIHGSAPRMVDEGRAEYADPLSVLRALSMLLGFIGYKKKSDALSETLDTCAQLERKISITGRPGGATCEEFTDYALSTLSRVSKKYE